MWVLRCSAHNLGNGWYLLDTFLAANFGFNVIGIPHFSAWKLWNTMTKWAFLILSNVFNDFHRIINLKVIRVLSEALGYLPCHSNGFFVWNWFLTMIIDETYQTLLPYQEFPFIKPEFTCSKTLSLSHPVMLGSSPNPSFLKTRGASIMSSQYQLEIYTKCHLLINHLETPL